ncbi:MULTISPECIES: DUF6555 family protein [Pseudomonas]|uniref:Uncharacterized protein n=1 Tax=Pseudomonas putida TaxID=303 RepID=A0A1B2F3Z8_PSEPU|nr:MULTISPECIES: DUF6555 family protein [Pseudomonas]ANY86950.1 hypothetical protein IEC33019_1382 [Pseudomonas putida]MCL8304469.1 hypothetical protein [Pseudomonas putida]
MPTPQLYIIDYRLHGQPRSFIIRLERMDNAEAWHWASCDAGVGIIPKFGREKIRKVSRPMAERYGVSEVSWRLSGSGPAFVPVSGEGAAPTTVAHDPPGHDAAMA